MKYGNHSTDVLWIECKSSIEFVGAAVSFPEFWLMRSVSDGFVPKENKYDSLPLDNIIFSELEKDSIELLKEENYYGYVRVSFHGSEAPLLNVFQQLYLLQHRALLPH